MWQINDIEYVRIAISSSINDGAEWKGETPQSKVGYVSSLDPSLLTGRVVASLTLKMGK